MRILATLPVCIVILTLSSRDSEAYTVTWWRQIGSSDEDRGGAVAGLNGDVLIYGETAGALPGQTNAGAKDAFLLKLDSSGAVVWTRQFGGGLDDRISSAAVDDDGNVYVAGQTIGLPGQLSFGDLDAFLRKYDADGNESWTREFGTAFSDHGAATAIDADGNPVIGGDTRGSLGGANAGGSDAFVRRYDSNGNTVCTDQFGSLVDDGLGNLSQSPSGALYVGGITFGEVGGQTTSGDADAYVRKYDGGCSAQWTRQFGTAFLDAGIGAADSEGGVYVAGVTNGVLPGQTGTGASDAFVRRYDSAGTILWTRQFGSVQVDGANGVAVGVDDTVYVSGSTAGDVVGGTTGVNNGDVFIREFDNEGTALCTVQASGDPPKEITGKVSRDPSGRLLLSGTISEGALPGETALGSFDVFVMAFDATILDTDSDGFVNSCDLDHDNDGCSDFEETHPTNPPTLGAQRNPLFQWDFYDVNGSKKVDSIDIGEVRAKFNSTSPDPPYAATHDRSPGAEAWAPGAPNGVINGVDIGLVRASFNHDCTAAP